MSWWRERLGAQQCASRGAVTTLVNKEDLRGESGPNVAEGLHQARDYGASYFAPNRAWAMNMDTGKAQQFLGLPSNSCLVLGSFNLALWAKKTRTKRSRTWPSLINLLADPNPSKMD